MHACAQFDFMHGVEFVWIICISVWILFVAWKRKKMRPQGLLLPVLIGKLIMSLWVGCLRVCVCLWKIQDLSLEAACDRGSSVLLTPLPLLRQNHWWEDRGFAFSRWREIRGQESEPNYRIEFSPNKTLQHVCGNEELCFCVRLICQWPPPNSCWLGRVFHCCWYLPLPACTIVVLKAVMWERSEILPALYSVMA